MSLDAQLAITNVRVDGREVDPKAFALGVSNPPGPLRLPPRPRQVQIALAMEEFTLSKPYRLRHKLEGFDADWVDLATTMRLVIRALDADNNIIGAAQREMQRKSPGWRGRLEDSEFTTDRLEFVVPERTAKIQLWFVSGGPEPTMGLAAMRNVRVRIGPPGESSTREVVFSTEAGQDLDQPLGALRDWARDGSRPEMARISRLERPVPHHVLVLEDTDTKRFAAWLNPIPRCVPVMPGERVVAEWEACYALGRGGPGLLVYEHLPAGKYWLRVAAVGLDDAPVAPELSLALIVPPPVWMRLWFWLAVGGAGSLGAIWSVRQITRRRMQRALDLAERRHELERERTRIARDIHDDLGTTLTQISMLSETARNNPRNPPETNAELDRICHAAREAVQAMDEIVWAADPENDSLDELATYLSGFAQQLLDDVGVRCRLEIPTAFPAVPLSAELRHHLFLAFKEALNNALKHGQPGEVRISLELRNGWLGLAVVDDGRGFDQPEREGHGLANMRQRIEKVGGRFSVSSTPGRGTEVRFEVPVPPE